MKLVESFPSLAAELSQKLREAGKTSLAEQIENAVIARVTFDDASKVGYIYVEPSRHLNVVESSVIGVRCADTISVDTQFWTNVDIDNFDRIVGIEILDPHGLASELRKLAAGRILERPAMRTVASVLVLLTILVAGCDRDTVVRPSPSESRCCLSSPSSAIGSATK